MQTIDIDLAHLLHAQTRRARTGERRVIRDFALQCGVANRPGILNRAAIVFHRIHDQADLIIFNHIDNVRTALCDFIHRRYDDSHLSQIARRAARGNELEAKLGKGLGDVDDAWTVFGFDADEGFAFFR